MRSTRAPGLYRIPDWLSPFRQFLISCGGGAPLPENDYGRVVSVSEAGIVYSVICGHGGSMWLCHDCAARLVSFGQLRMEEQAISWGSTCETQQPYTSN